MRHTISLAFASAALAVTCLASTASADPVTPKLPVQAKAARFFMADWKRTTRGALTTTCGWQGGLWHMPANVDYRCVFKLPPTANSNGYDVGVSYDVTRQARCVYAIDRSTFVYGVAILGYDQVSAYHACFGG